MSLEEDKKEQAKLDITNEKFLMEKIANFNRYISQLATNKKILELHDTIKPIESASIDEVIFYIVNEVYPYRTNLVAYVKQLFINNQIDITAFDKEELTKFKRYLECFIEIIG